MKNCLASKVVVGVVLSLPATYGLYGCEREQVAASSAPFSFSSRVEAIDSPPPVSVSASSRAFAASSSNIKHSNPTCPKGMARIEGGMFTMGAPYSISPRSDYYLHKVALRSYCLDLTEVSVGAYKSCMERGACDEPHENKFSCTWQMQDKEDHPINCLDFAQAEKACKAFGKRLPSEEEWEYAARGGQEGRPYSWGSEPPSKKNSCYNHPGTCAVKAHPPGAFGLFAMTGNVWEWTSSPFVKHAGWNPQGQWRVYRGGSYSRRFPRWMKTWVRNRFRPTEWGAHLGVRCAADLSNTACPEGSKAVEDSPTRCRFAGEVIPKPTVAVVSGPPIDNLPPPVISRDPQFDADCQKHKPSTPVAYRIQGSSFAQRQSLKRKRGCANRDVGPKSNSVCCPN